LKAVLALRPSRFEKDPDTGKTLRRRRPQSEWVVNQVEALRIVSDALFASAQARTRPMTDAEKHLKAAAARSTCYPGC